MDNLWLILLIVGAVISLSQKSQKRPQNEPEDDEQARDVLQKQLEEIFGRREGTPDTSRPTAAPTPAPAQQHKTAPRPAATPAKQTDAIPATSAHRNAVKPRTQSAAAAPARDTSHRNAAMSQANAKRQLQDKPVAAIASTHENNDLGRIVEEFDMERAVIYDAILKPKYEEY